MAGRRMKSVHRSSIQAKHSTDREASDIIFLQEWHGARSYDTAAVLRAGQMIHANPGLASYIRKK